MNLGAAIVLVVIVLLVLLFRSGPRNERLRAAAAPAIQALDRYAKQHGRYPPSLAAADAAAPVTAYGHYRYRPLADDTDCALSVGNAYRDGFVLTWDCASRRWRVERDSSGS